MKIASFLLLPAAASAFAPVANKPAFATQLASSSMPYTAPASVGEAPAAPAPEQQTPPPVANPMAPPVPMAPPTPQQAATTSLVPQEDAAPSGPSNQVYDQIDQMSPGSWWKGAYAANGGNVPAASKYAYASDKARATSPSSPSGPTASNTPREGRTWWMGVEGGIGYWQGGP